MDPETMISEIASAAVERGMTPADLCGSDRLDCRPESWMRWVRQLGGGYPFPRLQRRSLRQIEKTWRELCGRKA